MAAHIKKRKGKGRRSVWYLIDGSTIRSLHTDKKTVADQLLKQYSQGRYSLEPLPTVKQYYEKWIATKIEPLFRRAQQRDYRQHFTKHILAKWRDGEGHIREFGIMRLDKIGTGDLVGFRTALLQKVVGGPQVDDGVPEAADLGPEFSKDEKTGRKMSAKTCRNVIDSSFRAMFRDARAEYKELQGYDPFMHVQWPRTQREKPDPFTAEERDRIVQHWIDNDFFYYPWVFMLFHTGMRPSEASALTWNDINLERGTISISKSRYMGDDSLPKTSASNRTIEMPDFVVKVLELLPSKALGIKHVFINKDGKPMNAKKWSEHNWSGPLKDLQIRHRKFYATRHTFITEKIREVENPLAVAQYCGTSLAMIQDDYCGTLGLSGLRSDRTKIEPDTKNPNENMVAGPGFEPGTSRL